MPLFLRGQYFGASSPQAAAASALAGATYFAGAYWPAGYFAPSYYSAAAAQFAYRDRDFIDEIQRLLKATGEFEDVLAYVPPDDAKVNADRRAVVTIRRTAWSEVNESDPTQIERTVQVTLGLATRDEDPTTRFDAMERLEKVILNTLDGQSLLGQTIMFKTIFDRGSDDQTVKHPDARVTITGRFTYFTQGYAGRHSTS